MGRTKRKRNKKLFPNNYIFSNNAVSLQKAMKLKCPNLKISYFKDTGRGIKCKRKINNGDVLISLRLNQIITSETQSDVFSVINKDNYSSQLILSIWLVYEKHLNYESKYYQYIESLPSSYTNLYFCTEKEKEILPKFLKGELEGQKQTIKSAYKKCLEAIANKRCCHCHKLLISLYSRENFDWAWFTVNTRSVYYHNEHKSPSLALAPYLDMFNHSNDACTEVSIDFKRSLYILRTLVSFRRHEQVFIKYGPHSNLKLLIEYGFFIPDNPHDFISFSYQEVIECAKSFDYLLGDLTKLKYNFIKAHKLDENLTKNKEEFSWNLNGLLYILITEDQDLSKLQSKTYSNDFNTYENKIINKLKELLVSKKLKELKLNLLELESLKNSSECFNFVKDLLKIYINILEFKR